MMVLVLFTVKPNIKKIKYLRAALKTPDMKIPGKPGTRPAISITK